MVRPVAGGRHVRPRFSSAKKTKPRAASRTTNSSTATTTTTTSKRQICQCILLLALSFILVQTLLVLRKGHKLADQQEDAFAEQFKSEFKLEKKSFTSFGSIRKSTTTSTTATDSTGSTATTSLWKNLKILIAIASFDFSQIPHLEETLDGYHELCVAGAAQVHLHVHTTVMYPVALLDLYRTRFNCANFRVTFVIVNKNLRLHLVDLHRTLFYNELYNYDLFVYSEDDIRVTPTTVATYWQETQALKEWTPNDYTLYNIGVVRYEYNFPSGVVINDKTRHATENVTRVYWEHSHKTAEEKGMKDNTDSIPGAAAVLAVTGLNNILNNNDNNDNNHHHYVHMKNHHQGMYMATRDHLITWKQLPNCKFDIITDRPTSKRKKHQPLLGTQRVWMSSYQLYEAKYCNIQQVLPVEHFGALSVHHLPNKNYRRKQNGKTVLGKNKSDVSDAHHGSYMLVKALQLHIAMRQAWPAEPQRPRYQGSIQVIDEVNKERTPTLDRRLRAFQKYVQRGGVLSDEDMQDTDLIPYDERMDQLKQWENRMRRREERRAREAAAAAAGAGVGAERKEENEGEGEEEE